MDSNMKNKAQVHYFAPCEEYRKNFENTLENIFYGYKLNKEDVILLCIGSDKITGDCLGPLVGTKLSLLCPGLPVYGTLKNPVHAINLSSTLRSLEARYPHPFFIVIDAAVGSFQKIGYITLSDSPLIPGGGVNRCLNPIGNISITGITNKSSDNCELLLPYTRLYLVNTMADFIVDCLFDLFKTDDI